MNNFFLPITLILLLVSAAFGSSNASDQKKIDEIINGQRSSCDNFEQKLSPTLNFETFSPNVLINESSTQLSLQIKLIYYRCQKKAGADAAEFTVVDDPTQSYQYSVEKLDGSTSNVQVKTHKHRLQAQVGSLKGGLHDSFTSKIVKERNYFLAKINIPLNKVMTKGEMIKLRNGSKINVSIPTISELSTDYTVDTHIKDSTGFEPGSAMTWEIEFTMPKKGVVAAKIIKIK